MLRKIIALSVISVVVLVGVENLIAQEGTEEPQAEPTQRQRGRMERPRRRQVDSETRAGRRAEAMRERRQQEGADKIEAMKKKSQQEAPWEGTPRGRMNRGPQQSRRGPNPPVPQMFGRWYRGWQGRGRRVWGPGLQGRGLGRWGRDYWAQGICPYCQRGICPWYQVFQGRGRGAWGRGWQGRGMGVWGRGFQGRGMGGWGRGFQGRGMGGWGRGFQGRRMDRPGLGMPPSPDIRPFPPDSPEGEDVLVPAPPVQRRGMGRRGRALQEPNAPEPGPRGPGRRFD